MWPGYRIGDRGPADMREPTHCHVVRLRAGVVPGGTHTHQGHGLQKMDRNQDGVVTMDEFLETCQKVGGIRA